MLRKMGVNVVFLCCMTLLLVVGAVYYPPLAGAQGVDSYTKLMLHADGADQGTSFTDSSSGAKTVTNTESYDSYTKLALHMENNVTDSAAGKTVTNNNATFSSSVYKMGGYSGVFNGSNAYMSLADSDDWNFGSTDFTIDFWVRFNSLPSAITEVYGQYVNTNNYIHIEIKAEGGSLYSFVFRSKSGGNWQFYVQGGNGTFTTGVWYHIAFVREGSYGKFYQNGNWMTYSLDADTDPVPDISTSLTIGAGYDNDGTLRCFDGYLDELRISKGIARWTSDFTPPSSPYGKVATVTSQKKFGTASGEFHGSGDYLSLADSNDWNFGAGDFTIDTWVRFNNLPITIAQFVFEQRQDSSNVMFFARGGSVWNFYLAVGFVGQIDFTCTSTVVANTWYHIAIVRSSNTWYMFQDGVQIGITTNSSTIPNLTGPVEIGRRGDATRYLDGYLDELRISKGIARWTSNFTPPSAPYDVDTTTPTVSSTSPAGSATGVGVSSAISATFSEDMDSSTITTSAFTLSSSSGSVSGTVSYSNKVATFTPSSNLSYSTTYTATITTGVKDAGGNAMSSNYTWSFTTGSAPDTTAPSGSVTVSGGSSYTNSTTITLNLSATDNVGVTGYYLSDSSTTPSASASGWTPVTSTTSYSGSVSYTLSSGEGSKTIYAWYKDAAGNVSTTASATITYDTTVPTVTISSPTSSSTYTSTSSTISLGGSASDSSSGISSVSWSNNRGGNGTATGTASWTISSISLSSGDNVITVTAKDGANNSGTDTLQVTYGTGSTISAPTVSTGSASSVTTSSATLNGTVNANGASTTAWFNYGTTSGSYGNTSSTQTVTGSSNTTVSIGISGLSSGTKYYYRIAASNSGGTSYGSESSFTTSTTTATLTPTPTPSTGDTIAPTVTITNPTSSSTYTTTSSAITLSGTASDNSGSVSGVTWSNSKGGSGTASGTTSWTISSISLSVGDNVITVTATDGSGNFGTDTITVTYHVTTTPTPTAAPTGTTTPKPSPTAQPTPIPQVSPTATPAGGSGFVYGTVTDEDGQPLNGVTVKIERVSLAASQGQNIPVQATSQNQQDGVTVTIAGANGGSSSEKSTETDSSGYYEFGNLTAGSYTLTYEKDGYQTKTKSITLKEGEEKDIGTTVLEEEGSLGKIYGYVVDIKGNPLESVKLKLKGLKTGVKSAETSDGDGFFEFADLGADKYLLTAQKKRYRKAKQTITLEEGESREIEIEMRKTSKRIKGL